MSNIMIVPLFSLYDSSEDTISEDNTKACRTACVVDYFQ